MALESGVGRIVVDNIAELELLGALAKAAGKTAQRAVPHQAGYRRAYA